MQGATPLVRPLHAEDEPHLLAINRAGAPGVSLLSRTELAELIRLAAQFLVAEAEGRVIAYLIALAADAEYAGEEFGWFRKRFGRGFLYIDQIAVAPEWRRRGVGERLYRDLEEWARQVGIAHLVCEINLRPPNPSSLLFHAWQGFGEVATLATSDGRLVSLRVKDLLSGERSEAHPHLR